MRTVILLIFLSVSACAQAQAQAPPDHAAELLRLHSSLIEAHLNGDVESWMALEADSIVSANNGRVTFPSVADRRNRRTTYLRNATFERYRDVREPLVRISDDGSQGWLIAEVEVFGTYSNPDGTTEKIAEVWAWIELYERTDNGWRLVGNVSNSRPLE